MDSPTQNERSQTQKMTQFTILMTEKSRKDKTTVIESKSRKEKSKQNITRDIEVKNNLTIARGELGGGSEESGLQELL